MYLLKGNNGLEVELIRPNCILHRLSCYICIGNVAMYFFLF